MADLLKCKPLDMLMHEASETGEHSLKRALGPINLITLGIGAIIGAGIFVLTGSAAAKYAGPAIVLSFILSGIACVFAGLCYAEFASLIPIAGSAYTYGYATLGELFAWIIGWDLILEYAFGAATVASGWSGYLLSFLEDFGIRIPPRLTLAPSEKLVFYGGHWEHLERIKDTSGHPTHQSQHAAHADRLVQSGRVSGHRRRDHPAGDRHQGIGQLQFRNRDCEAGDRADVYRHCRLVCPEASRTGECQLASIYSSQ